MNSEIATELEAYGERLDELGFHPQTVKAYQRTLRAFLETNPDALYSDEAEAAEAIVGHITSGPTAYDDQTRDASLRKWHHLRYGVHLGRRRLSLSAIPRLPR